MKPGKVKEKWSSFKEMVYDEPKDHLGIVKRWHEDLFDDNSTELQELIALRNEAPNNMLFRCTRSMKTKYGTGNRKLLGRCGKPKNNWWLAKAAELQALADTNDTKGFY